MYRQIWMKQRGLGDKGSQVQRVVKAAIPEAGVHEGRDLQNLQQHRVLLCR